MDDPLEQSQNADPFLNCSHDNSTQPSSANVSNITQFPPSSDSVTSSALVDKSTQTDKLKKSSRDSTPTRKPPPPPATVAMATIAAKVQETLPVKVSLPIRQSDSPIMLDVVSKGGDTPPNEAVEVPAGSPSLSDENTISEMTTLPSTQEETLTPPNSSELDRSFSKISEETLRPPAESEHDSAVVTSPPTTPPSSEESAETPSCSSSASSYDPSCSSSLSSASDVSYTPSPQTETETESPIETPEVEINCDDDATLTQSPLPLPDLPATPPKSSALKRSFSELIAGDQASDYTDSGGLSQRARKSMRVAFRDVTVFYFPRSQGFTGVPSEGGSTLGMSRVHCDKKTFSLSEHELERRRCHREFIVNKRKRRFERTSHFTPPNYADNNSDTEEESDDEDDDFSDLSDSEIESDPLIFVQPVSLRDRRALLRASGIERIDVSEKHECNKIRDSRERCGCSCRYYCDPASCQCALAGIKCQVDRPFFPCGCSADCCRNLNGRIEFNPDRVKRHYEVTMNAVNGSNPPEYFVNASAITAQQEQYEQQQKHLNQYHNGYNPILYDHMYYQTTSTTSATSHSPSSSCSSSSSSSSSYFDQYQNQSNIMSHHHQQQVSAHGYTNSVSQQQQQGHLTTDGRHYYSHTTSPPTPHYHANQVQAYNNCRQQQQQVYSSATSTSTAGGSTPHINNSMAYHQSIHSVYHNYAASTTTPSSCAFAGQQQSSNQRAAAAITTNTNAILPPIHCRKGDNQYISINVNTDTPHYSSSDEELVVSPQQVSPPHSSMTAGLPSFPSLAYSVNGYLITSPQSSAIDEHHRHNGFAAVQQQQQPTFNGYPLSAQSNASISYSVADMGSGVYPSSDCQQQNQYMTTTSDVLPPSKSVSYYQPTSPIVSGHQGNASCNDGMPLINSSAGIYYNQSSESGIGFPPMVGQCFMPFSQAAGQAYYSRSSVSAGSVTTGEVAGETQLRSSSSTGGRSSLGYGSASSLSVSDQMGEDSGSSDSTLTASSGSVIINSSGSCLASTTATATAADASQIGRSLSSSTSEIQSPTTTIAQIISQSIVETVTA